jgi:hypothetical protein
MHSSDLGDAAFTLFASVGVEPDAEVRAAITKALRSHSNLRSISETLDWLANYDPSSLVRKIAAAEVIDASVLRPVWVAPSPSIAAAAGYWVTVEAADRAPAALYLPHGQPAFVFIRGPASATITRVEDIEPKRDANYFGVPPMDAGVIPLHVDVLLHPIHESP